MTRRIHSFAGAGLLALGLTVMAAGCATPAEPSAVAFTSLSESVESGSDVRSETTWVIRDAAELRRIWPQLFQGRRPVPDIDFRQHMLAIVALGERPTAGYGVTITKVSRSDRGLVVHVTAFAPGAGCATAAQLTYPVAITRLPASDRAVRFDFTRTTRPCNGR